MTMTEQIPNARAGQAFVVSRAFDVPRQRVWAAWTERAQLMEWFGPKGFKMPAAKLDFRPGGSFHYCLEAPNGDEMWGKFIYREIAPLERIVFVGSFSDEDGSSTRHPLSATWPLETLSTIRFTEGGGGATVTLRSAPLNATAAEQETFDSAHKAMEHGWRGTFDQLAEHLAKTLGE
jgi:uncharacterized protein YndB with AHSA1/START domain